MSLLLATPAIFHKTAGGGGGSAMASDASAIRSHVPSTVQRSGTTITAWNDQSGNARHLAQVGSVPLPAYNTTTNAVDFTGAELIGDNSFAFADGERNVLDAGGELAQFLVARFNTTGSTARRFHAVVEGVGTGGNRHFIHARRDSGTQLRHRWYNLSGGDAFIAAAPATADSTFLGDFLLLIQTRTTQTTAEILLTDGTTTLTESVAVTASNLANTGDGFYLGGVYTGSALETGFLNAPLEGDIRVYHSTSDNSTANVDAIRTELLADYL